MPYWMYTDRNLKLLGLTAHQHAHIKQPITVITGQVRKLQPAAALASLTLR